MDSSKERYPEFFQTFHPEHCSKKLRIQDGFLEHLTEKMPKKVILGNQIGNYWPVEIAETKNGLFFQKGWPRLVSDNSLKGGEFMRFRYDGLSAFNISIDFMKQAKSSGRKIPVSRDEKKMPAEEDEEEEVVLGQAGCSAKRSKGRGENCSYSGYHVNNLEKGIEKFFPSDNPFFVTKIRPDKRTELFIPHDIWVNFGEKFSNNIEIQDPKGRRFEGEIVVLKDRRHKIPHFWKQLCLLNKITEDDSVICEFMLATSGTCHLLKVHVINPNTI